MQLGCSFPIEIINPGGLFRIKKEELAKISEGKEIIKLNERQKKAIEFVKEKGRITNSEYQKLNNIHRNTATKDLNQLVKQESTLWVQINY